MVILDLALCPNLDLDVCRLVWFFLVKVGKLKVWKVDRFD